MSQTTPNGDTSGERPSHGFDPDDWDPNDPDATRVYYDLASWTFDQQAEMAEAMAEAAIPHGWIDSELVVPQPCEAITDELIAEVEARLGIVSAPLDGSAGDGDQPTTEYDLDEWGLEERATLQRALADAQIPATWNGAVLVVATADERVVDALLDDIESGEHVDLSAPVEPGEAPDAELLTTFFLAGERLRRDPLDADGLEQLLAATDVAEAGRPPFGVQPRLWAQACALADEVADALTADEGPELDQAMSSAGALYDLLRPNV